MEKILAILLWPWHMVLAACFRCQYWLATRPLELLVQGLPAVLVASVLVGVIVYEWLGVDASTYRQYVMLVNDALDNEDLTTAGIFVRKLSALDSDGRDAQYAQARLVELKGEPQRAAKMMHRLAPAQGSGHPAAHFWVASQLMLEDGDPSAERTDLLMHHFTEALGSDHDRQAAHIQLANLEQTRGNLEQAAKHLEAVVLDRPEKRLALSQLYEEMGDGFRARQQRERAVEHFRQRSEWNRADVRSRVQWAQAVAQVNDFEQAEEILITGLDNGDSDELKNALCELYIAWYDRLGSQRGRTLSERLEMLQRALDCDPTPSEAVDRLAKVVDQASDSSPTTQDTLRGLPSSGPAPGTVELVLGVAAAARGDWQEARLRLKLADGSLPRLPGLLSDVIWQLASAEPPQLARAIQLADAAVDVWPSHPQIRTTRGDVLVRMKHWREAAVELELALQVTPDGAGIHDKLAAVHKAIRARKQNEGITGGQSDGMSGRQREEVTGRQGEAVSGTEEEEDKSSGA